MTCHALGAGEGRISADASADDQRAPVKMYYYSYNFEKKKIRIVKLSV